MFTIPVTAALPLGFGEARAQPARIPRAGPATAARRGGHETNPKTNFELGLRRPHRARVPTSVADTPEGAQRDLESAQELQARGWYTRQGVSSPQDVLTVESRGQEGSQNQGSAREA